MNVPQCYIIRTLPVLILTSSLFAISTNRIQCYLICAVKLFYYTVLIILIVSVFNNRSILCC